MNPTDYGWDWQSSTTAQMYCSPPGDGHAYCTDNCDWCSQWKDGDSKPSSDDGNGFCSFKSIVTTHFEPVDMHVPEYNHTVYVVVVLWYVHVDGLEVRGNDAFEAAEPISIITRRLRVPVLPLRAPIAVVCALGVSIPGGRAIHLRGGGRLPIPAVVGGVH